MQPATIVLFAATLFAALVALYKWKRRRDLNAERVNRGLRCYVAVNAREPRRLETFDSQALPQSGQ